ncbi:succinate--CoA ligase subunit alpha [Jiella endophytica]|uniref:Succinate--CoA ligase subunit alpha n=1 Tax=Jiella endophytica TaxID=2558362 RepID=A0A4Y8R8A1_9HYPH|nr:succinate--CoA ligase subunit alpha [Jiella endophytica]TFF17835.1 succinate--CoA ligase subunit alpha [Jiella endophytica]
MSILAGSQSRVLVQGMTGWAGRHYSSSMLDYGTKVVAGVTPGKAGMRFLDLPIYGDVATATREHRIDVSIVFVPPDHAGAAMIEAIEAEVPVIVTVTERVPLHDMLKVRAALAGSRSTLVGPNSQGILSPGQCKIGVMATASARPGRVGVISRSASLTSEVIAQISAAGLGQSTTVGIGGDPICGLTMHDCLSLFSKDRDTDGVVVIGEIGGSQEEELADFIAEARPKMPIVATVVGRCAPPKRRMGHAGAFAAAPSDADGKIRALERAGVTIAPSPHLIGETIRNALRHADGAASQVA